LQIFVYRINISWWVFAGAGGIAAGLALILVGFHAIRSARSNPVRALHNE
jgi:putative ABC transport system permease protein